MKRAATSGSVGPWVVVALVVCGTVAALVTDWDSLYRGGDWTSIGPILLAAVVFAGVGAMVLHRAPGNRTGWVLSLIGLALIASGVARDLQDRGVAVAHALAGALWLFWFVLAGFLFLWFPTGRAPSPKWRVIEALGFLSGLFSLSYLFAGELCVAIADGLCRSWIPNPIGFEVVPNPEYGPFSPLVLWSQLLFLLASLWALVVRFRKSRDIERLQMKSFTFACVVVLAISVLQESLSVFPDWLGNTLFGLGVLALPTAVGVAILRYRLYGIERLISRTLGYALVAAAVGGVYVLVAMLIPTLLADEGSSLFVAGATLASAAVFNPLRRRILRLVDRRFYRSRYDAEMEMAKFASQLSERRDVGALAADSVDIVVRTMRPQTASVWIPSRPRGLAASVQRR